MKFILVILCLKFANATDRTNFSKFSDTTILQESNIYDKLFENYRPNVRPSIAFDEDVFLTLYVGLNNIIGLDSKTQCLVTVGLVVLGWHDPRLVFNSTEPRPPFLVVRPQKIWSRSFAILNSLER